MVTVDTTGLRGFLARHAQSGNRVARQGNELDCLIATFCLANADALWHRNHHFDAFEQHLGLAVLHPS